MLSVYWMLLRLGPLETVESTKDFNQAGRFRYVKQTSNKSLFNLGLSEWLQVVAPDAGNVD